MSPSFDLWENFFSSLLLSFLLLLSYWCIWPNPLEMLNPQICVILILQVPPPSQTPANAWDMVGVLNP